MLFDITILFYITYAIFYDIVYLGIFDKSRRQERSGSEVLNISSFYIVTGTLIICFSGVFEILGFIFFFDLLPFKISTFFINSTIAVQIGMAFILSQRFNVLYKQLKQSNIILENAVKERTLELEGQTAIAVEASRAALAAAEAKSEFLASISHDLKTPLAVLSLNLEALSSMTETQSNAQYQRHVRTAYQKNLDLQSLIQNLFEASRLETGRMIYTPQSESMLRLLAAVREKYDRYLEDQGIIFDILVEDDIEIMTDRARIWSVFDNIIYNAVRHSKSESITINAKASTVRITDNGCGIEAEHLPHIFERFYKVPQSLNEGESGLGLYLVKSIMEGCGGSVDIESESGKGTTVILTFKKKN